MKKLEVKDLKENFFEAIGKEWMLITAGDGKKQNTMTARWGAMSVMWGKNVVSVYLRPQRYTKEFVDAGELFTLSFYSEEQRGALNICGTKSGRDCDKEKEAGLTPYYTDGTTAFEEADMIFVCRKLYSQEMGPEYFTEDGIDGKWYPDKDYHVMYMAAVEKVLVKENAGE